MEEQRRASFSAASSATGPRRTSVASPISPADAASSPQSGIRLKLQNIINGQDKNDTLTFQGDDLMPFQGLSADWKLALAESLGTNPHITKIELSNMFLDDSFGLPLAQALQKNNKITHVNLENNNMTEKTILALLPVLEKNTSLLELKLNHQANDRFSRPTEEQVVKVLKENKTLVKFTYRFIDNNNGSTVHRLTTANNTQRIARRSSEVAEEQKGSSEQQAELANLRAENPSVASSLKRELSVPPALLEAIRVSSSDPAAKKFKNKILLVGENLYTDSTFEFVELEIMTWYGFGPAIKTYLAQAFSNNTHITKLNLSSTKLDDDFAVELAESLKTYNRTILEVNVENNEIGAKGIVALCEALETNQVMKTLRVAHQANANHGRDNENKIVASLKKNTSLEKFTCGFVDQHNNLQITTHLQGNSQRRVETTLSE